MASRRPYSNWLQTYPNATQSTPIASLLLGFLQERRWRRFSENRRPTSSQALA